MVDIHFKRKFVKTLLLKEIKAMPEISEIGLVKKGHRLSILPVNQNEFAWLLGKC
jgi:predicted RNA-binding protein with PUA-like domain